MRDASIPTAGGDEVVMSPPPMSTMASLVTLMVISVLAMTMEMVWTFWKSRFPSRCEWSPTQGLG